MTTTCPSRDVLRGLLDTSLPEPVQAEVVAHLDTCASCQTALEQIAASGSQVLELARQAATDGKPEATSAFWPALRRVEHEINTPIPTDSLAVTRTSPGGEIQVTPSYDFLDRSDNPSHLGMIERFQIHELIGRGGMGMVFRAFDACLQRPVAVKILDPQYAKNELARSRFIRE